MIIRTKDEYLKYKAELLPEVKDNRAFITSFEVYVEDMLHQGIPLDVTVTDEGKKMRVIENIRVDNFKNNKDASLKVLDANLMEDNSLEVIRSTGTLTDADLYFDTHKSLKRVEAKSMLSTFYERQEFDREGIEVIRTNYSKTGYPLKNINYDNELALKEELLSEKHMPKFDGSGVILPEVSNNAVVESYGRVATNPALCMYHRYERGPSDRAFDKTPTTFSLGMVSPDWPEMLRLTSYNVFADRIDGEWKVRKGTIYEAETFEETIRNVSLGYEDRLEHSMTKRNNLPEYDILKERLLAANKDYKLMDEAKKLTMNRQK
jgi:hypothetical protein